MSAPDSSYPIGTSKVTAANANLPAADTDKLEAHWVEAVDNVVKRTSNDPFLRTQEIIKLKADYVQQRFGKELKTGY